eukprot:gene8656-11699_t
MANQSNAILVMAAGNGKEVTDQDGTTRNVVQFLDAADTVGELDFRNIITVGAINAQQELASFSNYGNAVHVMAPGQDIITTTINSSLSDGRAVIYDSDAQGITQLMPPENNVNIETITDRLYLDGVFGTSFAAPHVAGALALMIARFPNATCPQDIIDRLQTTSTNLYIPYINTGLLNLAQALEIDHKPFDMISYD